MPTIQHSDGFARLPLCFPNGYIGGMPRDGCYDWKEYVGHRYYAIDNIDAICLPPIVNGQVVPPCFGPYYQITVIGFWMKSL